MGEGPGVRSSSLSPIAGGEGQGEGGWDQPTGVRASLAYNFAVKLDGAWIPRTDLQGPFEVDESLDTVAVLFSFALVGRRWSIQLTASIWTATPVEVWVTSGPIDALTTTRRAFGYVLACEQQEGIEPVLRVKCGDPSRLQDRYELCYEFAPDEALTRGAICRQILTDAGFTPDSA